MGAKRKVKKKALGRPRTITDKVMQELLVHISEGGTIRAFCRQKRVSRTQVHERMREPALAEPIARAREMGEEVILEQMAEIADTPSDHPDDVQHRKVQLWWREKQLVWMNPSKYAQRKNVEKTTTHKLQLSEQERQLRLKELLTKAAGGRQIEVSIDKPEES